MSSASPWPDGSGCPSTHPATPPTISACSTPSRGRSWPATVNEFAQHLFSPRAQGSMADSEAYAHLEHLRILGDFEQRDVDGVYEYVIRN